VAFLVHIRARERAGKVPLFSVTMFHSRTSNLGLVTQNIQWLVLQGSFFVISVFLQQIRNYSAIATGLMLMPATIGVLVASGAAERMAGRHSPRRLIRAGFSGTVTGIVLLLAFARAHSGVLSYVPGLLVMGLGIGIMLTASVNLVQSAWPEEVQGDISGLSRSVSNLGSSMGTALAGSVLVGAARPGGGPFALALMVLAIFALIGLVAAVLLPKGSTRAVAKRAPL
jgi:MFS family permease